MSIKKVALWGVAIAFSSSMIHFWGLMELPVAKLVIGFGCCIAWSMTIEKICEEEPCK